MCNIFLYFCDFNDISPKEDLYYIRPITLPCSVVDLHALVYMRGSTVTSKRFAYIYLFLTLFFSCCTIFLFWDTCIFNTISSCLLDLHMVIDDIVRKWPATCIYTVCAIYQLYASYKKNHLNRYIQIYSFNETFFFFVEVKNLVFMWFPHWPPLSYI